MTKRLVVLASGSIYRARVLDEVGLEVQIDPPEVDERGMDSQFDPMFPHQHALRLATAKAQAVAPRHPDALVIGCDQLAVLGTGVDSVVLHKQSTIDDAVDQLVRMAGEAHRLINALVVIDTSTGLSRDGIDTIRVNMRPFSRATALGYVREFSPFDTAGSYRLEDEEKMAPHQRLIESIECEDATGVLGMPVPLLRRLLASI